MRVDMATADDVAELVEVLLDVVWQACLIREAPAPGVWRLDSMGLSAYAEGLRLLARLGRVTIVSESGSEVIAQWRRP